MTTSTASRIEAMPPLREVIAAHGLRAQKSFGQHFLLDLNLTRRIARAAGDLGRGTTIEIGPGPGGLTRGLLIEGAAHVAAVELDRRCIAALDEMAALADGRLDVVEGDALKLSLPALAAERGWKQPLRIVSNLPYNVGTALLILWLGQIRAFESLTLMFQREVADRLVAAPRSKAYGRLSVLVQFHCEVERILQIPAAAFTPPPNVDSTVVRLTPRTVPIDDVDPLSLSRVTEAAFGQRRKMLRGALRTLVLQPEALLLQASIAPTTRAEELSVEQFCALARAYNALPATDAKQPR
ncbi:MAG: 16S rRNA (adenine(1518)-N(6)/adenine(1519)-N(6))-dimethyltransferase RsmA [Alphaproteobacteria bacterium]